MFFYFIYFTFILPGKSVKNTFLFSMTAWEQWVNCLFGGRMTELVSSGV
jgi:hypothetical protein